MQKLIDEFINALLPVILTVLSLGIAWLGKTLNAWLSTKVKQERLQLVLRRMGEVVSTVVLELQQTEVAVLKTAIGKDSPGGRKITQEEGALLLSTALAKVKSYLGADGLKLLMFVLGLKDETSLDEFLTSRIEATIHTVKINTPTVISTAEPIKPITEGIAK